MLLGSSSIFLECSETCAPSYDMLIGELWAIDGICNIRLFLK